MHICANELRSSCTYGSGVELVADEFESRGLSWLAGLRRQLNLEPCGSGNRHFLPDRSRVVQQGELFALGGIWSLLIRLKTTPLISLVDACA